MQCSAGQVAGAAPAGVGTETEMDGWVFDWDNSVIICVSYNGLRPSIGLYSIRLYVGYMPASLHA